MRTRWLRRFVTRAVAWSAMLLIPAGAATCTGGRPAAEFLVGIAFGMAASVTLRLAMNFDPEE